MKKLGIVSVVALISLALVAPVVAGDEEVTLEGKIICAKCALKEDRDKCQNVLVVDEDGTEQYYYLAMNKTNESFGDVCMAKKPVNVTGTVSSKDGKKWLTASNISPIENKG